MVPDPAFGLPADEFALYVLAAFVSIGIVALAITLIPDALALLYRLKRPRRRAQRPPVAVRYTDPPWPIDERGRLPWARPSRIHLVAGSAEGPDDPIDPRAQ